MSSLFAREKGEGPAIVLLHGFCETHEIWKNFLDPLTARFRIIEPDLPGFGNSPLDGPSFTIDQIADRVALWLAEKEIVKPLVIGHSLGGYVALSLLKRHGMMPGGIGLFHSTVYADPPERKENRDRIVSFVEKNGVPPFIETFVPGLFARQDDPAIPFVKEIALTTPAATLKGYTIAMRDRQGHVDTWTSCQVPRLLIAGQSDALIPLSASRQMAIMGSKVDYLEIPQVAHMGFLEAPLICRKTILEWASRVPKRA